MRPRLSGGLTDSGDELCGSRDRRQCGLCRETQDIAGIGSPRDEMVQEMIKDSAPYPAAGMPYLHDVIDPQETRDYIIRALEISQDRRTGGIGAHHLANWPTKF
jgi:hypothetical protein